MSKIANKKLWLVTMSLLLMFTCATAQTKTITGKVTDDKGTPLSGAVLVKGTKIGKATDETGSFSISVPSTAKTLVVTSVGFQNQEVDITTGLTFTISLTPANSALNDVVVVGYGTAKRKDVTGAISSISAKDFNSGDIVTPMDQVQGKVPGLVVTKPDGDPNSNPVIRLRGQTSLLGDQSPLLVVDGVILDNYEVLSSIPAGDIISYDFLKDASATSIYGSRGANGVILITTAKGKAGTAQLEYSGYVSVAKDAKYFDLLNTPEFLAQAQKLGYDTATIDNQGGHGTTTNWQKQITQTGYTNNHLLGISGGTDKFVYHASVNYQDQSGIVINTGRQLLGLRFNAQQKGLNNKLTIDYNILLSETNHQNVNSNIFYWAYDIAPVIPEKLNGTDNPIYNYNYVNPVWVENNEVRKSVDELLQGNIVANYEIIKGLKVGAGGNVNRLNTQYNYYLPNIPGANGGILNEAGKYDGNTNSNKGDLHINYNSSVGKSTFSATGVYEYNYYEDDYFYATASDFPLDINQENALGSGNPSFNVSNSYKEENKLISFLGRLTYNYDNKYYLAASLRRDGSSKFGVNNQWGYFPSVSGGWRLSKEKFLQDVTWIDELKLNAGYGVTGNADAIGDYNTQLLLTGSVRTYDPTSSINPYPVGYSANQNPNPDLKWEERIGRNVGVEFSFLKSRITGSVSYFNDKTNNLLYNYGVQTPPNYVSTVLANVGSLTNKGVELGLNVDVVRAKDVTWSLGGQITTVHTRVTSLSGSWDGNQVSTDQIQIASAGGQGLSSNPLTFLKVGYSPIVFYLPHYVGHDAAGNQLLDSAGVKGVNISGNPSYYYIDPSPKFTYGINTSVRYKQWSFSAAMYGNVGQKIYDNSRLNLANYPRFPGLNVLKETFTNGLTDAPNSSDYWLEKASYLRLSNLTIGYTVPKIAGIQNLRFYVTGNNLFVITPYKGLDPEIATTQNGGGSRAAIGNLLSKNLSGTFGGVGGGGTGQGYIDNNYSGAGYYPRARTYTFGVSISVK